MKTSHCRSCGAEIIWAITGRGSAMPVDAKPNAGGNIVLDEDKGIVYARVAISATSGSALRTSHFATCPNAATHRKTKVKA